MEHFPKIKKEFIEFVSNEDGRISQKSLIKMGIVSIGFLGIVSSVNAVVNEGTTADGRISYMCEDVDADDVIEVTCHNTIEGGGDITLSVRLPDGSNMDEMDMDMGCGSCDGARTTLGNWIAENWEPELDVQHYRIDDDGWQTWKGSDPFPKEVKFDLNYNQHENDIAIDVDGDSLVGTHEHSIYTDCQDIKIVFEASVTNCGWDGGMGNFYLKVMDGPDELCRVEEHKWHDS